MGMTYHQKESAWNANANIRAGRHVSGCSRLYDPSYIREANKVRDARIFDRLAERGAMGAARPPTADELDAIARNINARRSPA